MSIGLTTNRLRDLTQHADRIREEWGFPGSAVGIVYDDKVLFSAGFGHHRIGENSEVTPHTLFPIASATKSFTAMSLALLVEEGKLDWDVPLQQYWPAFRLFDPIASVQITVRDILCHRSGLPRHDLVWYNTRLTREQLVKRVRYLEPTVDFRHSYQYQNLLYTAAGHLVERLSGLSWEDFVKERILTKLGMDHSYFTVENARHAGPIALPYMWKAGSVTEVPFLNNEAIGPAGSMISCVEDMIKWLTFQLRGVLPDGQPLVGQQLLLEMHQPQMVSSTQTLYPEIPFVCSALGWFVQSYRGHNMIFHPGNLQGFTSFVSFLPEQKLGIVVLSQVDQSRLPVALTYEIYDRLLDLAPLDWHGRLKQEVQEEAKKMEEQLQNFKKSIDSMDDHDHPLSSRQYGRYEGNYHHPGYGIVSIAHTENSLQMKMLDNRLTFRRRHRRFCSKAGACRESKGDSFYTHVKSYFPIGVVGYDGQNYDGNAVCVVHDQLC
ncbi:hypothetical protein T458_00555 [Brevibacillus panacihumi W25]|uniref:Beta-lactamase-related domain-containing protein n=1 Tax=Brevibacillus panacihumi W25 TaxID=1408254 RepID=V6MB92_9BACL|nr:serine hydrolase domain-containing protein [Brevibacillus panacihumi]EST55846.1 hypothetical protein T458_00555 [Brevibacillus panacihumi W25]